MTFSMRGVKEVDALDTDNECGALSIGCSVFGMRADAADVVTEGMVDVVVDATLRRLFDGDSRPEIDDESTCWRNF